MSRHFSKDTQMVSEHVKWFFKSLARKEMKMKTRSCHFTSTRISVIKGTISSVGEDAEKLELSGTVGGNVKWFSHSEKQFGYSLKP